MTNTFKKRWGTICKGQKRVVVHISSMSFNLNIKGKYATLRSWQMNQIGRIIDLLDPDVSVVFITHTISQEADEYFKDIISSAFNVQNLLDDNRLLVIEVPRPPHFADSVTLSKMLLCNTEKMSQLINFLGENIAYLVPAVAGIDEIELCCELGIPLLGSEDAVELLAHNYTQQRIYLQSAGCSMLAAKLISESETEDYFFESFIGLINKNPNVDRWLFKMNRYPNQKGLAYFGNVKYFY